MPAQKKGENLSTLLFDKTNLIRFSSTNSRDSVDIPEDFNSKEFLLFAGFTGHVASQIWDAWQKRGDRQDWLIDDARHYIRAAARKHDAVERSDDWDLALREMGLDDRLRQAILHPDFESIRLTGCACSWALDTVNTSFDFLQGLDDAIGKKQRGGSEIERVDSPDESSKPRPAIAPNRAHQKAGSSSAATAPNVKVSTQPPLERVEGRTMFFKGGSQYRFEQAVQLDGSLGIRGLQSQNPTDFHPTEATYMYLTKHREVAHRYARYAEERFPSSKGAVLQIAIPNHLVSDAQEIYGDDWRDLIWNSRNSRVTDSNFLRLPSQLKHYENYDVLVSNLCTDSSHKIARMADNSELSIFKLANGAKASQHAFQTISRQQDVARQCTGFFWICDISSIRASEAKR